MRRRWFSHPVRADILIVGTKKRAIKLKKQKRHCVCHVLRTAWTLEAVSLDCTWVRICVCTWSNTHFVRQLHSGGRQALADSNIYCNQCHDLLHGYHVAATVGW